MPKTRTTQDPAPAQLTPEILQAVKAVLTSYPSGDQEPELEIHFAELKDTLKERGITASGDQLVLALKQLTRAGLIRGQHNIGVWGVEWISEKM